MKRISKFEEVSFEQFSKDFKELRYTGEEVAYDMIRLPKRSSKGSAGYDFVSPIDFHLEHGESIIIPTGVRCKINDSWFLMCVPRSGLGFKTHVRLANTTGIIDASYYYTDNEGHIMVKLVADKPISVKAGDRFCQGIFLEYGITEDDDVTDERIGGIGSSGR